jgi:hypothetical protein
MALWPFASASPACSASWERNLDPIKIKNYPKPAIAKAVAGFVLKPTKEGEKYENKPKPGGPQVRP